MRTTAAILALALVSFPAYGQEVAAPGILLGPEDFKDPAGTIVVIGRRPLTREEVDANVPLRVSTVPGDPSGEVIRFRPFVTEGVLSIGGQVISAPDQGHRSAAPPVNGNRFPNLGLRIELNPIRDDERLG